MMEIKKKLLILDRIYKVYDEILSRARLACQGSASTCSKRAKEGLISLVFRDLMTTG